MCWLYKLHMICIHLPKCPDCCLQGSGLAVEWRDELLAYIVLLAAQQCRGWSFSLSGLGPTLTPLASGVWRAADWPALRWALEVAAAWVNRNWVRFLRSLERGAPDLSPRVHRLGKSIMHRLKPTVQREALFLLSRSIMRTEELPLVSPTDLHLTPAPEELIQA